MLMDLRHRGSGTTTGSDLILPGHHLQVPVEPIIPEGAEEDRERTDGRSLGGKNGGVVRKAVPHSMILTVAAMLAVALMLTAGHGGCLQPDF